MIAGSFTALITPFTENNEVDYHGLEQLVSFQIMNGISGILAVGTTGESPTLVWDEHNKVIEKVAEKTKNNCICIAGTGSNNTAEALTATKHALHAGVDAVLLVDPYYNGPSSLEIRKEYIEPVAGAFPSLDIIPYIIPGRTGTQLLPEDLAILTETCKNVRAVKEATGNLENMKQTRKYCGPDFTIISGDDGLTFTMMTDPEIQCTGVISVISNIAPKAISEMVRYLSAGEIGPATKLQKALKPLFELVTVKTMESTIRGNVECRARNPLATKTLMSILGMPSGRCRQPLGRMTKNGIETVVRAARKVQAENPEIFEPAAEAFHIDIHERLNSDRYLKGLYYTEY
ncbi:MAG: 4-hydroxy-tetrahydrodipicolinate synthase [Desulfobacteraceae bacterium]|nr:MAG: 4-hydroxy-tetrahydrodipicolinate synthase [Desulfobacteraceae bacterium]